jgi:hypothetical protein
MCDPAVDDLKGAPHFESARIGPAMISMLSAAPRPRSAMLPLPPRVDEAPLRLCNVFFETIRERSSRTGPPSIFDFLNWMCKA